MEDNLYYSNGELDELEGFSLRKMFNKVKDKALKYTPQGIIASAIYRNRHKIGKALRKGAGYTPYGFAVEAGWRNRHRGAALFNRGVGMFHATGDDPSIYHDSQSLAAIGEQQGLDYAIGQDDDLEGFNFRKMFDKVGQAGKNFGKFAGKNLKKGASLGLGIASTMVPGVGSALLGGLAEKLGGAPPTPEGVVQAAQTPADASAVVSALGPQLSAMQAAIAQQQVMAANSANQAASVAAGIIAQNTAAKSGNKKWILIGSIAGGVTLIIITLIIVLRKKGK